MPWARGIVFTLLVPCMVGGYVPWSLSGGAHLAWGLWQSGWLLVAAGASIYIACLISFLEAGGTPSIFFTRPLRHIWGEEPNRLVRRRLYRYSRNPMYVGVVLSALGIAAVHASRAGALYACALFLTFHLVVILIEEPHLRTRDGQAFADYAARVPRWIGLR